MGMIGVLLPLIMLIHSGELVMKTISRCYWEDDIQVNCPVNHTIHRAIVVFGVYYAKNKCEYSETEEKSACTSVAFLKSCQWKKSCSVPTEWAPIASCGGAFSYYTVFKYDCQPVYDICHNGAIHQSSAVLMSPNYPSNYAANQQCFVTIQAAENSSVSVFSYHFQIQQSSKCIKDYVRFDEYDGHRWHYGGAKCGNVSKPGIIFSSNHSVISIQFITDTVIFDSGFILYYQDSSVLSDELTATFPPLYVEIQRSNKTDNYTFYETVTPPPTVRNGARRNTEILAGAVAGSVLFVLLAIAAIVVIVLIRKGILVIRCETSRSNPGSKKESKKETSKEGYSYSMAKQVPPSGAAAASSPVSRQPIRPKLIPERLVLTNDAANFKYSMSSVETSSASNNAAAVIAAPRESGIYGIDLPDQSDSAPGIYGIDLPDQSDSAPGIYGIDLPDQTDSTVGKGSQASNTVAQSSPPRSILKTPSREGIDVHSNGENQTVTVQVEETIEMHVISSVRPSPPKSPPKSPEEPDEPIMDSPVDAATALLDDEDMQASGESKPRVEKRVSFDDTVRSAQDEIDDDGIDIMVAQDEASWVPRRVFNPLDIILKNQRKYYTSEYI